MLAYRLCREERVGYARTLGPLLLALVALVSCAKPNRAPGGRDGSVNPERMAGNDGSSDSPASGGAGGAVGPSEADGPVAPDVGADVMSLPQDPACQPGFHTCGATCVDDRSPANCGRACAPCPPVAGGTPSCDGTRCGATCPAGKKVCLDGCIDEKAPCDNTCPKGQRACNSLCVDVKSVAACGEACLTCPSDPNGVTTCDGEKCELVCNAGFHRCGDRCLANTSPASCGTACTACSAPTGGTATCDGSKCGSSCPSGSKLCAGSCIAADRPCNEMCPTGTHDCGGNCVRDDDVNNCGTSCSPCAPPANADATCQAKACGFACRAGFHLCDNRCVSNNSVDSCGGSSCTRCPAPAAATAICNGTACDFRCDSGRKCGDRCIPDEQPCADLCGNGRKLCGAVCIPNNQCCVDTDCPRCQQCVAGGCANQGNGDDRKNECGGRGCRGGDCAPACVPQTEVCDNKDNDCDGKIDEELAQDCSTTCGSGQRTCVAGVWNSAACPKTPNNSDASACGTSCDKCASTALANGVCQGGSCRLVCKETCSGQAEGCGDCGGTRTCNPNTCTYSACGPSCCPNAISDRWAQLSYSSDPWRIIWPPADSIAAKPALASSPAGVILPRDSLLQREPMPSDGFIVSFELAVDSDFAFHLGLGEDGPYPAVRRFGNGPLTLGGLTYGRREEADWQAFGSWNNQTLGGASVKITLFVKAGAKQMAVSAVAAGATVKSGFVGRQLAFLRLIGSHLQIYNQSTKTARVSSLTGCSGLTDTQVQALYDRSKSYP